MPALKIREKKYFLRAFYFGTLFLGGVSFAYFGVMPAAIKFAIVYADWMGADVPFLNAMDYSGFPVQIHAGHGRRL
jgi:Sec-independent protein secretion pathway component TatC